MPKMAALAMVKAKAILYLGNMKMAIFMPTCRKVPNVPMLSVCWRSKYLQVKHWVVRNCQPHFGYLLWVLNGCGYFPCWPQVLVVRCLLAQVVTHHHRKKIIILLSK